MTPETATPKTYALFRGDRLLAQGPLEAVLGRAKAAWDQDPGSPLCFIDEASGRSRDFDLRGSLDEALARALPPSPARGPGRPRLGVSSREVSLLPRHWDWLDQQPQGASAALRRLVDEARQREPDKARARRLREAVDRAMLVLAGDRPGYEEALRALYARDRARFKARTQAWPADLRRYLRARFEQAEALDNGVRP